MKRCRDGFDQWGNRTPHLVGFVLTTRHQPDLITPVTKGGFEPPTHVGKITRHQPDLITPVTKGNDVTNIGSSCDLKRYHDVDSMAPILFRRHLVDQLRPTG